MEERLVRRQAVALIGRRDRRVSLVAAPSSESVEALAALMTRRRQLLAMLVSEKVRLPVTASDDTRQRIDAHITWLEREMELVAQELQLTVQQCPVLRRKHEILRSVPGVGEQTALVLLAHLPELGEVNRKQIAALAGLAPFDRDDDGSNGRRIWGGRARIRAALYMAAMVASRPNIRNPVIGDFYRRLLAADKPRKLALTACMRKLLVVLNTMIKDGSPWDDSTAEPRP